MQQHQPNNRQQQDGNTIGIEGTGNGSGFKQHSFRHLEEKDSDSLYITLLRSPNHPNLASLNQIFIVRAFRDLQNPFKLQEFLLFKTQFKRNELPKSGICGKMISEGEIAYQCQTCEMDHLCFICSSCFENGNHSGHNFQILRNPQRVLCDCGDHEAWKPKGFCKSHGGFVKSADFEIFDQREKLKFKLNFVKVFYYMLEAFEMSKGNYHNLHYYSFLLQQFLTIWINVLNDHIFLSSMIAEALTTKVCDLFQNVKLNKNHNCQEFQSFSHQNKTPCATNRCSCTPLDYLFRMNPYLDFQAQNTLNSFLIILFNFYEFKEKFTTSYLKNFKFTVNFDIIKKNKNDPRQLTELFKLSVQLFASEKLTERSLEKSKAWIFLETLTEILKEYDILYRRNGCKGAFLNQIFNYKILYSLRWLLFKRKSIVWIFKDKIALEKLFQIFELLYKNRFRVVIGDRFDIDIQDNAKNGMEMEVNFISIFMEIFSSLISGVPSFTMEPFMNFMRKAQEFILKKEDDFRKKNYVLREEGTLIMRYICLPVERAYICGVVSYLFFQEEE